MEDGDDAPVRRLGLMGGTFDPVHLGHLVVASEALHAFALDRVLFVPTGRPWQKQSYSDPEDRFVMTTLAAGGHPRFAVSRMELDRRGPTYTVDTVAQLRAFHGDEIEVFFIAGADAMVQLGSWYGLDRLRGLVEMIAVARPGFDLASLAPEDWWPAIHVLDAPSIGISATDVRDRVRRGRPIDFLVPSEVARYIRDKGLYAAA